MPQSTTLLSSVKPKSTWALLKDHFERLVSSYVFPQLSFNESRRESWENDPVDFVRTALGRPSHWPIVLRLVWMFQTNMKITPLLSPLPLAL